MRGLPQKQNARRAYKIRLCGHLRRYKKIVKKTYIIYAEIFDDKQVRSICDSRFEQILEFLNEENILPTELYNPGFMTGLSGIAYALLKYKMPKLPLLIGVEGIYDRNEV